MIRIHSMVRCAVICGAVLSALAFPQMARADDEEVLKQNAVLVKENREIAMGILKVLEVPCSPAMPTGGTTVENNHVLFCMNQYTFKLIAAKIGAKPVMTTVTVGPLLEQNHAILMQNREVMMSIAEKLELKLPKAEELKGTLAEKNHQLLTANKSTLEMVAKSIKK